MPQNLAEESLHACGCATVPRQFEREGNDPRGKTIKVTKKNRRRNGGRKSRKRKEGSNMTKKDNQGRTVVPMEKRH